MKEHQYSIDEIGDIIDMEGLEYAVLHYTPTVRIEDPQLRLLWDSAKKALEELTGYVEANRSPVEDEGENEE